MTKTHMYDTNRVWNDLSTTGRAQMTTVSRDPILTEQLREEAAEQDVSVKVDYKMSARGDYNAYVYLRKGH